MRLEDEFLRKSSGAQLVAKKNNLPSKKGKRRKRRPDCMPSVVQRLFDTCKAVFAEGTAGFVPPPEDVARIRSILDSMKPADVGLSPKLPYFKSIENGGPPPITYLHVYECPEFSIGIFCLPPSAVLPLHNHPGMTVFSKLLLGSMHIKSYDWVVVSQDSHEPSHVDLPSGERLAKVKTDDVFTAPCETSILYPSSGGNMHCFTAKTACVVLDVLGPPYSDPERNCTYYYAHAYAKYAGESGLDLGEGEGYSWLQERAGQPEELLVVGAKYRGPNIVED
ncbi:plant cysteine oxidase 2 [Phalaenopsis equestris]|uniref:plant cysteine oxidase 2 n=1 Tax=Phalaenopsis equestris TaxID=78828 RepID=UPI0009E1FF40|nr:plant cysteine oxidase 2 [Phalaenopsis equestris]